MDPAQSEQFSLLYVPSPPPPGRGGSGSTSPQQDRLREPGASLLFPRGMNYKLTAGCPGELDSLTRQPAGGLTRPNSQRGEQEDADDSPVGNRICRGQS